ALVIGTGLEDNKPFANVKGIEWRTRLRCSRKRPAFADFSDEKDCFRRDPWATRNLPRRLSSAVPAQFDRSQPVAQPILSIPGRRQQRRLQRPATARLWADSAFATPLHLAIHLKRADRSDREKIASFHKEEDDRELPRVRRFSRGRAPSRFAALHRCSLPGRLPRRHV